MTHIEGEVNPVRDLEIICEELRLKDIERLNIQLDKLEKLVVRGNDKKLKPEYVSIINLFNCFCMSTYRRHASICFFFFFIIK